MTQNRRNFLPSIFFFFFYIFVFLFVYPRTLGHWFFYFIFLSISSYFQIAQIRLLLAFRELVARVGSTRRSSPRSPSLRFTRHYTSSQKISQKPRIPGAEAAGQLLANSTLSVRVVLPACQHRPVLYPLGVAADEFNQNTAMLLQSNVEYPSTTRV